MGNSNSGRKSAYQENADAKTLAKMFFDEYTLEEIRSKLKSGKHSIQEAFMLKALEGSERHQVSIFQKVFPDKFESTEEITLKIDV